MKKIFCILLQMFCLSPYLVAQFDGAVGTDDCKAIHCKDKRIIAWATSCEVIRGYQDIALKDHGLVSYGKEADAIGAANDSDATRVISLGDGGVAVLQFETPIMNHQGYDFVVLENSLNDHFLELGFVEVSSDGIHYVRFPATSNTPTDKQVGGFGSLDPTKINNLAGKYRLGWGTPFDLSEVEGDDKVDVNAIRYVKIIDVVGSIDTLYASHDTQGQIINDPYPTDFASGGFDLAGVGVINNMYTYVADYKSTSFKVYPNPFHDRIQIEGEDNAEVFIYNNVGRCMVQTRKTDESLYLNLQHLSKGMYIIVLQSKKRREYMKITK